jgi:hypothetical protein
MYLVLDFPFDGVVARASPSLSLAGKCVCVVLVDVRLCLSLRVLANKIASKWLSGSTRETLRPMTATFEAYAKAQIKLRLLRTIQKNNFLHCNMHYATYYKFK